MKKSKITIIAMFGLVAIFLIAFIVCFNLGDHYKAVYDYCGVQINSSKVKKDPDLLAWWQATQAANATLYTVFSTLNYACSILAIASLGIGLALSDKFKAAEEKAAEDGLEIIVKPGSKKRKATAKTE